MTIALWIQTILVLFIFFGNLFLALLVLLKGSDRGTNIRFALVVVATSFWVLLSNGTNLPLGLEIQTIILKVDLMVGVISAFLFLIFCSNLPRNNHIIRENFLILLGFVVVGFAVLTYTEFVIADTWLIGNVIAYKQGILDVTYALFVGVLLLLSLVVLVYNITKEPVSRLKLQAKYILLASFIPVVMIIVTILFLGRLATVNNSSSLLATFFLPSIGRFSVLIFTCITTYSILKYRLFGIRVLLGKMLFWFILLIVISAPAMVFLGGMSTIENRQIIFFYMLYSAFVVVLFGLYEVRLKALIKTLLIRYEYDSEDVFNSFSTKLLNTNNIDLSVDLLFKTIYETVSPCKIGVIIEPINDDTDVVIRYSGFSIMECEYIDRAEIIGRVFSTINSTTIFTVSQGIPFRKSSKLITDLVSLSVDKVVRFRLGKTEALLILGKKNNSEEYLTEELMLIKGLIDRFAISVLYNCRFEGRG